MNQYKPPKIDLHGSPYDIGLSHGRAFRVQIHNQLDIYRDLFFHNCKFEWSQVLKVAEEFRSSIERLTPDYLEEMRGIADGVGDIDILDIIALNARSEIALGQWDDGCTSLAWRLGESGKQILAQNWDWRASVGPNLVMVSITQPGKPQIWMVTEPGIIGKIGFNSSSVGVCLNAIRAKPISTSLLPIHLLLRLALESSSVGSAVSKIESFGGAASSQHILIADTQGSRGLELSPLGGIYLKEDSKGILVHSNHFLENKLVEEPPWLSGSPFRLERIRTLCEELANSFGDTHLAEEVTPAVLRQIIFSDTANAPQAICCSLDPSRGVAGKIETLFNIVMVFDAENPPRAEVIFGKPGGAGEVHNLPW